MNYSNIGNLPKDGPGTNNLDGWEELFQALSRQDDLFIFKGFARDEGWVQAPEVLTVQDRFFDTVLAKNYSKYFEINTDLNEFKIIKPEIKNIGPNEAIELYNLCLEYAKNVLSAIRTVRLNLIDTENEWIYGRGDDNQNTKFVELKRSHPGSEWVSTAIQMNIDGCLYSADINNSHGQQNMEFNIILLTKYIAQVCVPGAPNKAFYSICKTFNLDLDQDMPAKVLDYWRLIAQNPEYLSYDPTTKSNAYTGNFLINPIYQQLPDY
jgi:hypothetical protein